MKNLDDSDLRGRDKEAHIERPVKRLAARTKRAFETRRLRPAKRRLAVKDLDDSDLRRRVKEAHMERPAKRLAVRKRRALETRRFRPAR